MDQSTKIFGTLLLAFAIYALAKGELQAYLALFTTSNSTTKTNANAASVMPALNANIPLSL